SARSGVEGGGLALRGFALGGGLDGEVVETALDFGEGERVAGGALDDGVAVVAADAQQGAGGAEHRLDQVRFVGGGAVEGEEGLEGVVFGRGRERLERSGGAGDVERAVGGVVEVLGQQGRRAFVSHGRERIGER